VDNIRASLRDRDASSLSRTFPPETIFQVILVQIKKSSLETHKKLKQTTIGASQLDALVKLLVTKKEQAYGHVDLSWR
jgi:hypothetical protein